ASGHVPDTHLPRPWWFLVPRDRGQESAVRRKSNMHDRVSLTLEFAHTFAIGRIMNMNNIRYVAYGDGFAVGSEGNVPCKLPFHGDTQSLSPGGPIVDPHGVILEIGKSLAVVGKRQHGDRGSLRHFDATANPTHNRIGNADGDDPVVQTRVGHENVVRGEREGDAPIRLHMEAPPQFARCRVPNTKAISAAGDKGLTVRS